MTKRIYSQKQKIYHFRFLVSFQNSAFHFVKKPCQSFEKVITKLLVHVQKISSILTLLESLKLYYSTENDIFGNVHNVPGNALSSQRFLVALVESP